MTFHWSPILLSWEWTICVHNEVILWSILGKHLPFCKLQLSFPETLRGVCIAVQNIPLNIQKRNEQSINEGSWLFKYSLEHAEREWTFYSKKGQARFFCAFCVKFFCEIFDFKTLLWPPGEVLVVLQYAEECSSAFLTQKNLQNQYCVGPTYTNFFRNRASVRRFSSNFFWRLYKDFWKRVVFWVWMSILFWSVSFWLFCF